MVRSQVKLERTFEDFLFRHSPLPDRRHCMPASSPSRVLDTRFDRRLAEIRAVRDPAGRFASYLTSDPAGLNVHG